MAAVAELAGVVGVREACATLGVSPASYYRAVSPSLALAPSSTDAPVRTPHPRRLADAERQQILEILHSPRFRDAAPAEVYAALLDEGTYLASERTMYRLLAADGETGDRRNPRPHPAYAKPELVATAPNQLWSWDITKLFGPAKWTYFYLYVVLDVFSRYVVGWLVADRQLAALAERLLAETAEKEQIGPDQLTLHADRGSPMIAKPVAFLLADLGITKSHSRPHVSNDNPFSESQFKTLKYWPSFPTRFASIDEARTFCRAFFAWYNTEHRHVGIGLMTPLAVHTGHAAALRDQRIVVLQAAYAAHPERFVRGAPTPPPLPEVVWINPPKPETVPPEEVHRH
jgi:putative transposase